MWIKIKNIRINLDECALIYMGTHCIDFYYSNPDLNRRFTDRVSCISDTRTTTELSEEEFKNFYSVVDNCGIFTKK